MARSGYGAQFKRGDGGTPTEVFTAIAELAEVTPPNRSRDSIETTHHGSPNGHKEFIAGLADGGEVPLTFNYTNASYVTLNADFEAGAVRNYQVVGPNGAIWAFSGFMTALEGEIPIDDKMVTTATFKVTGRPVYTAGS